MKSKFLRRDWSRHPRLGKRKKKKLAWRRPKGRDNKMRERRRGYPAVVSIGYKKGGKLRAPIIIKNIKDLERIKEDRSVIIGNVGKRKKIEIAKKAKEKKIKINNLNIEKYLEKNTKEKKEETADKPDKNKTEESKK